jgi:hypothetical protein
LRRFYLCVMVLILAGLAPGWSWWPAGHGIIAHGAVLALPQEVPPFFRSGGDLIAHCSFDPDVAKNRQTPNVRDAEEPEHYIDYELLQGRPLPPTRYQYLKLCGEAKLDPEKVGTAPYAVAEWTERLTVALAEHRKWPENPSIRTKCLVYAGFLAHYAGDLCQPLHCTVHHDGRAKPDGSSPRTGIHQKVDALIEKLDLKPEHLAGNQKVEAFDNLMPAIVKEIELSRSLIDHVYELEQKLPPAEGALTAAPPAEVGAFTVERGRASTRFLASLYLTAWKKSAGITLPPWLKREARVR